MIVIVVLAYVALEITQLSKKVDKQYEDLSKKVEDLSSQMKSAFLWDHEFKNERLMKLSNSSLHISLCSSGIPSTQTYRHETVTAHSVYFDNVITLATAAHSGCNISEIEYSQTFSSDEWILCPDLDVMLYKKCLDQDRVFINITASARLRIGDDAVAYGYVNGGVERVLSGVFTGRASSKEGQHLKGADNVIIGQYEYLIGGIQYDGMSGAGAANGCGYLGVVHARDSVSNVAVVVSASELKQCITKNKNKLKNAHECGENLKIESLPNLLFDNCHNLIS